MRYVIGVDIGTSSTKSVLFDTTGQQIGREAQRYGLRSPEPGAAEQDPDEILQAATQTAKAVIQSSGVEPAAVIGLSFSAAMHTLLLLDKTDRPLTPMYTWADNRSDRWAAFAHAQDSELYARTGIPPHPMSPLVKLIWLHKEQPDIFTQAARVVSIKEYILFHWCQQWVIDASIASTTALLNLKTLKWDSKALELAGILPEQLSKIVPTTQILPLGKTYAQKICVPQETPIIVGASDGVLANLGVGAIDPGVAAITLGTSGAVRRVVPSPMTEGKAQLFCYALNNDKWVMGGAVNNGGVALQWARDSLVPYSIEPDERNEKGEACSEPTASTYDRMTKMAEHIAPGADGLIFHPYLLGERAPLWDATARASFFGLSRNHTQAHLVRAVMEGVLYNMQAVFAALVKTGGEVETLRASGGFAHSALWQQMLADIFDRTIEIPTVIESSAFGAAGLALVALGEWDGLETVGERVAIAHTRTPIVANVSRYQKILPLYTRLSTAMRAHYKALQQTLEDD